MKRNLALLIIGFFVLFCGLSVQHIQQHEFAQYSDTLVKKVQAQTQTPIQPVGIALPEAGINTQVKPGGIVNGQWILSDSFAHYISFDPKNNTIIFYAHEREGLFVDLKKAKVGNAIYVTDKDGNIKPYTIYSIERIKPTDVTKLTTLEPNSIALYTCDGMFDQYRLFVKARPIK